MLIPCRLASGRRRSRGKPARCWKASATPSQRAAHRDPELLTSEIGPLKRELDGFKKNPGSPAVIWHTWIAAGEAVAVVRQCVLAGVFRATVYAQQKPKPVDEWDLRLSRLIDEESTRPPFYGSRKRGGSRRWVTSSIASGDGA